MGYHQTLNHLASWSCIFQPLQLWEINGCCLSHSVYGSLLIGWTVWDRGQLRIITYPAYRFVLQTLNKWWERIRTLWLLLYLILLPLALYKHGLNEWMNNACLRKIISNQNRFTDIENKLMVTKDERRGNKSEVWG